MHRLSKTSWGWISVVLLFLMLCAYFLGKDCFIDHCLHNWNNSSFVSYTGRCTSISYDSGREASRYNWHLKPVDQYLTGQGWHLYFENGKEYYIPAPLSDNDTLCNQDNLSDLVSRELTIRCLPETFFPGCNMIVSLKSGAIEYLNDQTVYVYLAEQNVGALSGTIYVSPIVLLVLIVIAAGHIWIDLADYSVREEKERRKQERHQQLKAAGLLHPSKQLRKNQARKTKRTSRDVE